MVRARQGNVVRLEVPARPREAPEPIAPSHRAPLLDDVELLAALRRDDETAALSLYRRTRPNVERTVERLLGRHDPDRDDIVQSSLIAIVDSVPRFRGESSLDTWVARVTAHTVFKALRKRKSDRRLVDERAEVPSDRIRSSDGDSTIESRDLVRSVRALLDQMDHVKAYTVLLHDVCGYDLREVAEITETTVAAAQSRLVRARAELHERIERDPELRDMLVRKGEP